MRVFGKEASNSRRMLAEALAGLETPTVLCWGAASTGLDNAINNIRRLDAIGQLTAFNAAQVPTIEWTQDRQVRDRWTRSGAMVFGRTRVHTQGKDIVGAGHRDFSARDYWVKVVPNVAEEWRIHVLGDKVIARGLKVQTGLARRAQRGLPIRNRRNGWTMVHTVEPTDAIRELAVKATKACGYDIGAVDILKTTTGELKVLEVNQAPGLDDYTCGRYVGAITRRIERAQNRARQNAR